MGKKAALSNLRVLDFTWVLAGPYATRILADFGAEVIKVQSRVTMEGEEANLDGYFTTWNRNKLGITLNLSKPQAAEIAGRLLQISDVVVENFSPRVMRNWGLDYDTLSKGNPRLIMASMSGMGQAGPWKDRVAFGATIQAVGGITNLTTFPSHSPIGLSYSYADHIAGMTAALAILEALEYRERTGLGQYIDFSQLEAMCSLMGVPLLDYTVNRHVAAPVGNGPMYRAGAPHNVYRCCGEDRWCAICVFTNEEWQSLVRVMGNPDWARDERFSSLERRGENAGELDRHIEEWTLQHTAEEVMGRLQVAGVAAGVVQNAADLSHDPQLAARGFYVEAKHPVLGNIMSDASPIKLSGPPSQFNRPAPLVGQHNDYVFRQLLGLSEEEITQYEREGVFT